jgi:hypothetical protein
METKTLLTIVALLLAGMLTIMLARGDERRGGNVLLDNSGAMKPKENAGVYQMHQRNERKQRAYKASINNYQNNSQNNYQAMDR